MLDQPLSDAPGARATRMTRRAALRVGLLALAAIPVATACGQAAAPAALRAAPKSEPIAAPKAAESKPAAAQSAALYAILVSLKLINT